MMSKKRMMDFIWMYGNLSEAATRQALHSYSAPGEFERNWNDLLKLATEEGVKPCDKKWKK
jgi:hypothetical protein